MTTYAIIYQGKVHAVCADAHGNIVNHAGNGLFGQFTGGMLPNPNPTHENGRKIVVMDDEQFLRFFHGGKMHASGTHTRAGVARLDVWGTATSPRIRPLDRPAGTMKKWDVGYYGVLQKRAGPWGGGYLTNRDHVLAHSSNTVNSTMSDPMTKQYGLAIAVSGKQHREASYTYGGRTKKTDTRTGQTRVRFAASHPDESVFKEIEAMLEYKEAGWEGRKTTDRVRIEMIGGYRYLYKRLATSGVPRAVGTWIPIGYNDAVEDMLLDFLEVAIANDVGPR